MPLNPNTIRADADLQVVIRSSTELSDYQRWQVRSWQAQAFDLSEAFAAVDWYVFGLHAEQWVSMLEITQRTAKVNQQPIMLGLIGSVVTLPHWRRQGYASALLQRTTTFLCQQRDVAFALLLCMDGVVSFYERGGGSVSLNRSTMINRPVKCSVIRIRWCICAVIRSGRWEQ